MFALFHSFTKLNVDESPHEIYLYILVLLLRSESLHSRSLPPKFSSKSSYKSTMAPRKWIADGCNFQKQDHRSHRGQGLPTNKQSITYRGHRLHLTAETFRRCPTIPITRRSTPSDALRDESKWRSSSCNLIVSGTDDVWPWKHHPRTRGLKLLNQQLRIQVAALQNNSMQRAAPIATEYPVSMPLTIWSRNG